MKGYNAALVSCLLLVFTVTATGCSQKYDDHEDARAIVLEAAKKLKTLGETDTAKALSDGKISYNEYLNSARNYQKCLRDIGISLEGPYLSPVDNLWLLWKHPETIPANVSTKECDERWRPVTSAYVDSHEEKMNESLRVAVSKCMHRHGYKISGKEKIVKDYFGEIPGDTSRRAKDAESCIIESSQQLFPELPGVVVLY